MRITEEEMKPAAPEKGRPDYQVRELSDYSSDELRILREAVLRSMTNAEPFEDCEELSVWFVRIGEAGKIARERETDLPF